MTDNHFIKPDNDVPERDLVGELAHLITGSIAAYCCHKTGGYNDNPRCECRSIAEDLIDSKDDVVRILTDIASKSESP